MCSTCKVLTACLLCVCLLSAWLVYGVLPEARAEQVITHKYESCPECPETECQPVVCNCSTTTEENEWREHQWRYQ